MERINIESNSEFLKELVDRLYDETLKGNLLGISKKDGSILRCSDKKTIITLDEVFKAREEFAKEKQKGEKILIDTTREIIESFFPKIGGDRYRVIHAKCCSEEQKTFTIPLDSMDFNRFLKKSEIERIEQYMPECVSCGLKMKAVRSFFLFEPLKKNEIVSITARVKNIADKLTDLMTGINKESGAIPTQINRLHDSYGIRIITQPGYCFYALQTVCEITPPFQIKDYIGKPKENGYMAWHVIGRRNSTIIETQIADTKMSEKNEYGTASYEKRKAMKWKEREEHPLWKNLNAVIKMLFQEFSYYEPSESMKNSRVFISPSSQS